MEEGRKLEKLIEEFLEMTWQRNPVRATDAGIHKYDHLLGEYSKEAIDDYIQILKDFQNRLLEEVNPEELNLEAKLDFSVLKISLNSLLLDLEERALLYKIPSFYPQIALYGVYLLLLREFAPLEERVERMVKRMEQIPRVLREGKENVINPPKIYTQIAIETTKSGILFLENLIPDLKEKVPALRGDLERVKNSGLEALENYLKYLQNELWAQSKGNFALGEILFNRKFQNDHLLDLSHDQLLEIGEKALLQIKKELETLSQKIDPSKNWIEIIENLKEEYPPKEQLLSFYGDEMGKARQFLLDRQIVTIPPGEDLKIVETPLFERNTIPFAAYMPPAPFEKRQKGYFYVTPVNENLSPQEQAGQLRGHNKWGAIITAIHEAYPGHHLQLVRAHTISSPLRRLAWNHLFGEGWALYCEEMMYEEGYYTDKRVRLFQLKDTLWRAIRVILDVKLHTGKMSFEDGVDLLVRETGMEEVNATAEVKRYTLEPTQPLSYLLGKMEIIRLRENYRKVKGNNFSLREFHDRLLSFGAIPLKLIEERILGN